MTVRQHPYITTMYLAFMASKGWIPAKGESVIACTAAFRRHHHHAEYIRFHDRMLALAATLGAGVCSRYQPFGVVARSVVDPDAFHEFVWAHVERDAEVAVIAALDAFPWSEATVNRMIMGGAPS